MRNYGYDPLVREYLDMRFADVELSERDRHKLYLLFLPLGREQFKRLLPHIELILTGTEESYRPPIVRQIQAS